MHISSLPSPYGIGALGGAARDYIDFLSASGQSCWQLLPVSPTGYGDSPYQSFSSYAGNPYFVDLDVLEGQGFLEKSEYAGIDWGTDPEKVDYGKLYDNRFQVLGKAAERLLAKNDPEYARFSLENCYWLDDYALFMALKSSYGGAPWSDWDESLRHRVPEAMCEARQSLEGAIGFYKAVQFLFYRQWDSLRAYARSRGIEIIGDIPIYVAPDSADVWAHPEFFKLDENLMPTELAGCPPDGFTEDGQLWGNPLYDWKALRDDDFNWWIKRIDHQFKLYDILRIDHFRGLDSYYSIPGGAENARTGKWNPGPGMDFFKALGRRRIIAEDLGFMTDSVRSLLKESGYPGMKVLQFAFDSSEESDYLPHNFIQNCVAYTGTHDNSTILGWLDCAPEGDIAKAREYMRVTEKGDFTAVMLSALWGSVADLAVASMQDLLRLDDRARMNTPGTFGGNWQWRMSPEADLNSVSKELLKMTKLYGRKPS